MGAPVCFNLQSLYQCLLTIYQSYYFFFSLIQYQFFLRTQEILKCSNNCHNALVSTVSLAQLRTLLHVRTKRKRSQISPGTQVEKHSFFFFSREAGYTTPMGRLCKISSYLQQLPTWLAKLKAFCQASKQEKKKRMGLFQCGSVAVTITGWRWQVGMLGGRRVWIGGQGDRIFIAFILVSTMPLLSDFICLNFPLSCKLSVCRVSSISH